MFQRSIKGSYKGSKEKRDPGDREGAVHGIATQVVRHESVNWPVRGGGRGQSPLGQKRENVPNPTKKKREIR